MKKMKRLKEKIGLNENESHLAKSQSFEENVNHERWLNNFLMLINYPQRRPIINI